MIYLVLCLLFGGLGAIGFGTVRWNGKVITGFAALPCAVCISGFLWVGSTVFTWLALAIGFPMFRLAFQPSIEADDTGETSKESE